MLIAYCKLQRMKSQLKGTYWILTKCVFPNISFIVSQNSNAPETNDREARENPIMELLATSGQD